MKTYKTWEAIKAIEENEKLEFENSHGTIIKYENLVIRFFDKDGKNIKRYGIPLDTQWTLIQKPVTFMEAIEAYSKGKTIKCYLNTEDYDDAMAYVPDKGSELGSLIDDCGCTITQTEILEGKWYIEEG